MKKAVKPLLLASLLLLIASFATCHFGVEHEINKIPPEVRAGMNDFDWIGVEWIARGMLMQAVALVSALVAAGIWLSSRKPKR